jgi:hypothetical protein
MLGSWTVNSCQDETEVHKGRLAGPVNTVKRQYGLTDSESVDGPIPSRTRSNRK